MRAISRFTAAIGLAVAVALATASPATAGVAQPTEVSTNPAGFTPDVNDGAVQKLLQVGAIMYAGGYFTSVTKGATFARQNLFSFNATTGAVQAFTAKTDGPVWALASDGRSLYVGGDFTTVNGVARRGLAKLNLTTGALDPNFDAHLTRGSATPAFVGGRLIIGGAFRKALQAVDPVTGADTGYINLGVSGSGCRSAGTDEGAEVRGQSGGHTARRRRELHHVSGQPRGRAFMVDLGRPRPRSTRGATAPRAAVSDEARRLHA